MNCKNCHTIIDDDSKICPICGANLEQQNNQEITTNKDTDASSDINVGNGININVEVNNVNSIEPKKKTWVKIVAGVLCVVLLLGLGVGIWSGVKGGNAPKEENPSGNVCYTASDDQVIKNMDKVVATCGNAQLTNSQLQVHYWLQFFSFLENYGAYASYLGLDYTKPLYQQMMDENTTWEQYFLETALDSWHRFQALLKQAEEEGFEMPATVEEYLAQLPQQMEQTAATYGFASVNDLLAQDMGVGCDIDDYVEYMGLYAKSVEYMDHMYAQIEPTEDQIREFVAANAEMMLNDYKVSLDSGKLVDVRHVLIQPEGCEFNDAHHVVATEDQWEACRVQAQALLDGWLAGAADEESFAQLAMANSVDGSASSGGIYTDVYKGQMVKNFEDWCFDESRKTGDSGLVRTEYGYHIMYFVAAEEGWLRYGTEAYITDAYNTMVEKAMEIHPMEVDYKNISLGMALSMATTPETQLAE